MYTRQSTPHSLPYGDVLDFIGGAIVRWNGSGFAGQVPRILSYSYSGIDAPVSSFSWFARLLAIRFCLGGGFWFALLSAGASDYFAITVGPDFCGQHSTAALEVVCL